MTMRMMMTMVYLLMLMMTHSGPGLWVLSQVLLLLYFKMDNGSNVCGIEFNYNNNVEEKKEEVEAKKEGDMEEEKEKREEEEYQGKMEDQKEDDSKSIISENAPNIEVLFNHLFLRKLILGKFEVLSEEGRSVYLQLLIKTC